MFRVLVMILMLVALAACDRKPAASSKIKITADTQPVPAGTPGIGAATAFSLEWGTGGANREDHYKVDAEGNGSYISIDMRLKPESVRTPLTFTPAEVSEIRKVLEEVDFVHLARSYVEVGICDGDAWIYTLTIGGYTKRVECGNYSPPELDPLAIVLNRIASSRRATVEGLRPSATTRP